MKLSGRIASALSLLSIGCVALAHAEVAKYAFPLDSGFHLVWWPKLSPPASWVQDFDASVANAINVLVLTGESFSDAETIIYARAIFREEPGTSQTLAEFMDDDFNNHRSFDPAVRIEESSPLKIADGTDLRTFTFFPENIGNWEKVVYGEDGQFYLLFVLSSRTREGYQEAIEAFASAVRSYTREPNEQTRSSVDD